MVICAIVGCGNRSVRDRGKSFYRLPAIISNQGTQTEAWLAKIRREDISPKQYYNIRVCSDHFINGSPSRLYDETNPDWAPSLKLVFEASACGRSERYDCALKRRIAMKNYYCYLLLLLLLIIITITYYYYYYSLLRIITALGITQ